MCRSTGCAICSVRRAVSSWSTQSVAGQPHALAYEAAALAQQNHVRMPRNKCLTGATRSQGTHLLCMLHGITLRDNLLISQLTLQQALCLNKFIFLPVENRFCVLAAVLI